MISKVHYIILILAGFTLSCTSSTHHIEPIERVQLQMGTYARVVINGGTNEDVNAAFSKIKELDNLLSDYIPESEISVINKNAGIVAVEVDPQVMDVLTISKNVALETKGVFDPTIGAITIGVYGFGREKSEDADIENIEKAKSLVNYHDLILQGDSAFLRRKGMMLDLGAIGKGFAVQAAADVLKERNVNSGLVSLSGDIRVFGNDMEISIKNPDNPGAIATFETGMGDLAISTSGGYERYVNIKGEVYHHLIVPSTGKPGSDFLSLTVVMEGSSTLADAYATALFIMGKDSALKFLKNHEEIGVFIVYPDKSIYHNQVFSEIINNLKVSEYK